MSLKLGPTIDCIPCYGFTIDYGNGFIFCYTIGHAIGHAISYMIDYGIDYTNDKATGNAIDYAIGKVNWQWLLF